MPRRDPNKLYKQLMAVVDERTTSICLIASGQIQEVDVPYDTIAGPFQEPPFHDYCRSVSAPYMPGMGNPQSNERRREMRKRGGRKTVEEQSFPPLSSDV